MSALCGQPVTRKPPKKLKSKVKGLRGAQTEQFIKLTILGTPKLCWADQVKFEFWGVLEVKKGQKRKLLKIGESLWYFFMKSFETLPIFENLL